MKVKHVLGVLVMTAFCRPAFAASPEICRIKPSSLQRDTSLNGKVGTVMSTAFFEERLKDFKEETSNENQDGKVRLVIWCGLDPEATNDFKYISIKQEKLQRLLDTEDSKKLTPIPFEEIVRALNEVRSQKEVYQQTLIQAIGVTVYTEFGEDAMVKAVNSLEPDYKDFVSRAWQGIGSYDLPWLSTSQKAVIALACGAAIYQLFGAQEEVVTPVDG